MKLKLLLFLFSFGISTSVSAEIVLYCNSELGTGIAKENGIWRTGNFKPERYTLKFSDDYSELEGLSFAEGIIHQCTLYETVDTLVCASENHPSHIFTYNKKTKRFLHFREGVLGFIQGNNAGNETNSMHAGTCKKF
jgi:hypothetical protein